MTFDHVPAGLLGISTTARFHWFNVHRRDIPLHLSCCQDSRVNARLHRLIDSSAVTTWDCFKPAISIPSVYVSRIICDAQSTSPTDAPYFSFFILHHEKKIQPPSSFCSDLILLLSPCVFFHLSITRSFYSTQLRAQLLQSYGGGDDGQT